MNLLRAECTDGWYELSPFQAYDSVRGEASAGRRFDAWLGVMPAPSRAGML